MVKPNPIIEITNEPDTAPDEKIKIPLDILFGSICLP
jgi:hypothetical protein